MSNDCTPRPEETKADKSQAKIIPVFVCPGAKEVPIPHAVFPLGSGFTEMRACPIRDCCMWYAEHDLGGETSMWDFPPEAILPAEFRVHPFHCARFRDPNYRKRRRSA